jgi:hypothetical protein
MACRIQALRMCNTKQICARTGEMLVSHVTWSLDDKAPEKLVALYKRSIVTQGAIWKTDSFDQCDVKLGMILVQHIILKIGFSKQLNLKHDSSTKALIKRYCSIQKECAR